MLCEEELNMKRMLWLVGLMILVGAPSLHSLADGDTSDALEGSERWNRSEWNDYFKSQYPDLYNRDLPEFRKTPQKYWSDLMGDVCPVYARNKISIAASPKEVFDAIVNAKDWQLFYLNGTVSEITSKRRDAIDRLEPEATFKWKTLGHNTKSKVVVYDENRALGWISDDALFRGFHRWVLRKEGEGTHVMTDECHQGLATIFYDREAMARSLTVSHQLWLEGIGAYIKAKRVLDHN